VRSEVRRGSCDLP